MYLWEWKKVWKSVMIDEVNKESLNKFIFEEKLEISTLFKN